MISQAAHFESCQKAKNARLYAICDAGDDLRNRMAQIWEPEVAYSQYEEMLADPKVEAAFFEPSGCLQKKENRSRLLMSQERSDENRYFRQDL
jgi:hypothetical protein